MEQELNQNGENENREESANLDGSSRLSEPFFYVDVRARDFLEPRTSVSFRGYDFVTGKFARYLCKGYFGEGPPQGRYSHLFDLANYSRGAQRGRYADYFGWSSFTIAAPSLVVAEDVAYESKGFLHYLITKDFLYNWPDEFGIDLTDGDFRDMFRICAPLPPNHIIHNFVKVGIMERGRR